MADTTQKQAQTVQNATNRQGSPLGLFEPDPNDSPEDKSERSLFATIQRHRPLLVSILGLAFGRAGLIVASYGSYSSTDEGIFTDGAMIATLAVFFILLVVLAKSEKLIPKPLTNMLAKLCFAAEIISLGALFLLEIAGINHGAARFLCSVLATVSGSGAIFYWLRRARGASTVTATILVFGALAISEIELLVCAFIPLAAGYAIALVLASLQFPFKKTARKHALAHDIESYTPASDYVGFTKDHLNDPHFLMSTAVGIGLLSIVIGLLRGFPDGDPIAFTLVTRCAYGLLTVVLCGAIIALVITRHQRIMTVGMFVLMEILACLALLFYAAFPHALDIGAVSTTTLNAMMVAFTWYVIIAFMGNGWRDPYYYALAGWLVWLGCRSVARVALIEFAELSENDVLTMCLMGSMIVLSTQAVLLQFFGIAIKRCEKTETTQQTGSTPQPVSLMTRIMGLDEHESLTDVRQVSMRHNAEEIGRQFLLSDREIEVLALYALGFTQKRVAEELYISPGTAHAHIKRIYAKTGLHSRQEILDYLQQYTS